MPLQFFLGGAAPVFAVTASGGPLVGGTTPQPTITFAVSGAGGPLVGATVDQPTITFDVSGTGGAIVGQTIDQPTITFDVTASGGPVAGETIDQPTIDFAVEATGGPVVGATVDQPFYSFDVTASGGAVVASTFEPSAIFSLSGSGGPVVGEQIAPPFLSFFPIMSGGVLIASHTNAAADYPIVANGGPILSSVTIEPSSDVTLAGSGGPLIGSAVDQPGIFVTITGTGGVLVSQHLQPPQPPAVFFVTGSGGVVVTAETDQGRLAGGFYHVYMNDGNGGAVDYDFPVETTSITTWTTGSLPYPGDYSFHVRAFYGSPYLEEHNLDARIRVVLDATGHDVTGRPAAPTQLAAVAVKGGSVRLSWLYKTPGGRAKPSKFNVYAGTPGVSYASTKMMIAYGSDDRYFAVLTGLTSGLLYQFVVRAANATAEEKNTNIVTATADSDGPRPPQNLVAISV